MSTELVDQEIAALRRDLIRAAAELMSRTGNRPFSAILIDGQPLIVAVGTRSNVQKLADGLAAPDAVIDVDAKP